MTPVRTWLLAGLAAVAATAGARAETASLWVRSDGSNFMPRIVDAFNKGNCSRPVGWYGVAGGGKRSDFWVDDGLGI